MTLSRAGLLAAALAVAGLVGLGPHTASFATALGSDDFPAALTSALALVQLVVSAWIVALVAASRSRRAARLLAPPIVLRALFVAGAVSQLAAPAHAEATHDGPVLTGLRLPDRPVGSVAVMHQVETPGSTVTVKAGDTLWAIAAAHLPPGATDAQIVSAVAAWHETNQRVIGADPDHIEPGQVLAAPQASA